MHVYTVHMTMVADPGPFDTDPNPAFQFAMDLGRQIWIKN
jgi:hypothetical protein